MIKPIKSIRTKLSARHLKRIVFLFGCDRAVTVRTAVAEEPPVELCLRDLIEIEGETVKVTETKTDEYGRAVGHSLTPSFGKTEEGIWVAENCWRFGFIIRYREEWTEVTGYSYEPWHIRYVGEEHAGRIYECDIPLEYYVMQLKEAQFALAMKGV